MMPVRDKDDRRQQLADTVEYAREVLDTEARAVLALKDRLDGGFVEAVRIILACRGRIVVSGIGKSGHIARKIASTLASTGTPAFFVHAAEASHGDLGMITRHDVLLALSNSGESTELLTIVPLIKRQGAKLIALTGNPGSSLAREADAHLYAGAEKEACPLNLAPTASTTAALALGDALAVALMKVKGFKDQDFKPLHPGGGLQHEVGRRIRLTHVRDIMRTGGGVPAVAADAMLPAAIGEMSAKGMGMTAVVDSGGRVLGIFTDGDLRRALQRGVDPGATPVSAVMTREPRSIAPDRLATEAVRIMEDHRINRLLVTDEQRTLLGALNLDDLFRAKVI